MPLEKLRQWCCCSRDCSARVLMTTLRCEYQAGDDKRFEVVSQMIGTLTGPSSFCTKFITKLLGCCRTSAAQPWTRSRRGSTLGSSSWS
jgi:hypothetical protein